MARALKNHIVATVGALRTVTESIIETGLTSPKPLSVKTEQDETCKYT